MIVNPTKENIAIAAELIKSNNLVGIPTETVYGLAANALSPDAVKKIYQLKERPANNPLIVHVAEFESIFSLTKNLSDFQKDNLEKLKVFWPGPLTIILPKADHIPTETSAGLNSVAIRIPSHPVALDLIRATGLPLAAPSANKSTKVSPTNPEHVENELGDELGLILDGGACQIGIESTVLSLLNDKAQILRPGFITAEDLTAVLKQEVDSNTDDKNIISPGQSKLHYSPDTKLEFFDRSKSYSDSAAVITLANEPDLGFAKQVALSVDGNFQEIASNLFATIRELDALAYDLILIEKPKNQGIGLAILDRLNRAIK